MNFCGHIIYPLYEVNKKNYIDIKLPPNTLERVRRIHRESESKLTRKHIQNPLQGTVLKVKVPFSRKRVTCTVHGVKTVQELVMGDVVHVKIDWCGVWEVGDYCGFSWKLNLIETPNMDGTLSS